MGYKINGHPELNPYISMFAHSIEQEKKETGRKKSLDIVELKNGEYFMRSKVA